MIKKLSVFSCGLLFSISVCALEECPNAVDVADSLDQNRYAHCDYKKTGLNGALHRTLSKKETPTESSEESSTKKPLQPTENKKDAVLLKQTSEFSSPEQLQQARFLMLQKAMQECSKGFVVNSESYTPAKAKSMQLALDYHCL